MNILECLLKGKHLLSGDNSPVALPWKAGWTEELLKSFYSGVDLPLRCLAKVRTAVFSREQASKSKRTPSKPSTTQTCGSHL